MATMCYDPRLLVERCADECSTALPGRSLWARVSITCWLLELGSLLEILFGHCPLCPGVSYHHSPLSASHFGKGRQSIFSELDVASATHPFSTPCASSESDLYAFHSPFTHRRPNPTGSTSNVRTNERAGAATTWETRRNRKVSGYRSNQAPCNGNGTFLGR